MKFNYYLKLFKWILKQDSQVKPPKLQKMETLKVVRLNLMIPPNYPYINNNQVETTASENHLHQKILQHTSWMPQTKWIHLNFDPRVLITNLEAIMAAIPEASHSSIKCPSKSLIQTPRRHSTRQLHKHQPQTCHRVFKMLLLCNHLNKTLQCTYKNLHNKGI